MKKMLVLIMLAMVLGFLVSGCTLGAIHSSKTMDKCLSGIHIGMTIQEMEAICGKPFDKDLKMSSEGTKVTVTYILDKIVGDRGIWEGKFENGKLISFESRPWPGLGGGAPGIDVYIHSD